jgi:hypothetical protein
VLNRLVLITKRAIILLIVVNAQTVILLRDPGKYPHWVQTLNPAKVPRLPTVILRFLHKKFQ